MAKTAIERGINARNPGNVAETTPDLSKKTETAIDKIRKPFMSFVKDFAGLAQRREELAPLFMKAFGFYQAETGATFVAFIRHLDPSIGGTRNEYRNHRTYQAADYLRRIVGNVSKRNTTTADGERQAAPAPPTDALARILASLMQVVPEAQQGKIFEAMKSELHWTDRQVDRITTQVQHVDPLVEIKGRTLENLRLSMPEHEEREAAA